MRGAFIIVLVAAVLGCSYAGHPLRERECVPEAVSLEQLDSNKRAPLPIFITTTLLADIQTLTHSLRRIFSCLFKGRYNITSRHRYDRY
jgi:hypothetical protein